MTDREPLVPIDRLTPVTPLAPRPPADHALHDRLLVVRFGSHERLDATETAAVHALLDGCPDCATLMVDIGVIARATAYSSAPGRPRDFQLTPEQAEELRGSWWHRLLGRFDSAHTQVLRPLAGAVLAVGLVLTVVGTSLPGITSSATRDLGAAPVRTSAEAAGTAAGAQDVSATSGGPEINTFVQGIASPGGQAPISPRTKNPTVDAQPQGTFGAQLQASLPSGAPEARLPSPTVSASVGPDVADIRVTASPEATPEIVGQTVLIAKVPGPPVSVITLLGFLLAIVGAIVLALVWLARRSHRDSLLR